MVLLNDFTIPKPLILRQFFVSFFGPISGPPLGGSFRLILATKVPIYTPQVGFGSILGTQDVQERPFGRHHSAQKAPKRLVLRTIWDAPWPSWPRTVSQTDLQSPSHRFRTVLQPTWVRRHNDARCGKCAGNVHRDQQCWQRHYIWHMLLPHDHSH